MFRSRDRQVFRPTAYGTRRRRRIPRWLVLMLSGVILGAGGLLFLQKSYGPTRLTVEESEQLQYDLNSADLEKQRLQSELNQKTRELKSTQETLEVRIRDSASFDERIEKLEADIERFVEAMPADPRATSPGIHAASFRNVDGKLDYRILLMQTQENAPTFEGNVELVVEGRYSNGRAGHIDLEPFDIKLDRYLHIDASQELPDHFTARQVTIKVKANGQNKLSATRTLIVAR